MGRQPAAATVAGLALVGLGVLADTAPVHYAPHSLWLLVCPLFVCGLGMGCCFGSLFAVALGEVSEEQAGSASGTLNPSSSSPPRSVRR
ncbi:MAG: hypothetical protein ACXVYY_12775 [Oryzihumus sp.]